MKPKTGIIAMQTDVQNNAGWFGEDLHSRTRYARWLSDTYKVPFDEAEAEVNAAVAARKANQVFVPSFLLGES